MNLKQLEETSKPIDGAYPIELSQGSLGKLVISGINTVNNETTVTFTADGKAPAFQASYLYISDIEGEKVDVKSAAIREDDEKPNEFKWVFKALNQGKNYRVGTDMSGIDLREDLKFNIELNR